MSYRTGSYTMKITGISVDADGTKPTEAEIAFVDPMTGESDWKLRSSYQPPGDDSWDNINVFDVRSASDQTALNGDKYSDW